jgi:hypothetical protein
LKSTHLLFFLFLVALLPNQVYSQIVIPNSSFEEIDPIHFKALQWTACKINSSPDLLPGPWGVTKKASDGQYYLGLITRENNSYESVSINLNQSLEKDSCYVLVFDLAKDSHYSGYKASICLRFWAGGTDCEKKELLFKTEAIEHNSWKTYSYNFIPSSSFSNLIIEAYYKTPTVVPYRGNILLDSFRPILKCKKA